MSKPYPTDIPIPADLLEKYNFEFDIIEDVSYTRGSKKRYLFFSYLTGSRPNVRWRDSWALLAYYPEGGKWHHNQVGREDVELFNRQWVVTCRLNNASIDNDKAEPQFGFEEDIEALLVSMWLEHSLPPIQR